MSTVFNLKMSSTYNPQQTWYIESNEFIQQKIQEIKSKYSVYCEKKDFENALVCINKLISMGPYKEDSFNQKLYKKWINCHAKIGINEWIMGNFANSTFHWKKILEKDITFGVAYYYIGLHYWIKHDNYKAIQFLEKAVILKPDIENYQTQLDGLKKFIHQQKCNEDYQHVKPIEGKYYQDDQHTIEGEHYQDDEHTIEGEYYQDDEHTIEGEYYQDVKKPIDNKNT